MRTSDLTFHRGDVELRYRSEGSGPALVLIHGWTLDLDIWDLQAAEFAHSMHVIRLDRRGFGLSTGVPDPLADAGDLAALLDHLQVARAAIVGMSQGARVALQFAVQYPARVAALVLDGPPDVFGGDAIAAPDLSVDELRALARRDGIDAFRHAWRGHSLMQLRKAGPTAQALLARVLARYNGRDLRGPPRAAAAPLDPRALATLLLPALVLSGRLDAVSRRDAAERLLRALPGAERAWVEGAGHLPNLDDPAAYNAALRAFLQRQAQAAA